MKVETIVKVLTYLIGVLSFAAIFVHIGVLYSVLFIVLFVLSIYFEYNRLAIPRWALTAASLLTVIYFLSRFNLADLVTQMLEALLILLAIKFLEQKKVRDYMQIYAISLFLLSGTGLLAFSIVFLVYVLIFVFLLSISFIFLTYYAQAPGLEFTGPTARKVIAKSLWIPILAIPLSVLMFAILPRSQYPLLDFLNRPDKAKTGFTDKVMLGRVSDIQEDSSIIFRAGMKKINDDNLYWRGITLDLFDGRAWRTTPKKAIPVKGTSDPIPTDNLTRQTIYLEAYENSYLFCLDKPLTVIYKNARRLEDLTYTADAPLLRRVRYEVTSIISDTIREESIDRATYLQIPEGLSEGIMELTRSVATSHNAEDNTQRVLAYLNGGQYQYSMKGLPLSQNPLEVFLLQSKYGNCEYFASAMALMLRITGIPSRLVGGYRGGYYNEIGKYYIVPQKNAHVWVEAFLPARGWVRFDPTPASSEGLVPALQGNTLLRMSLLFDTINYYWYTVVINYNLEKQISIAQKIAQGWKRPSLAGKLTMKQVLSSLFVALPVLISILGIVSIYRKRTTKEKRLIALFQKRMARKGYKRGPGQGLEEFALTIENSDHRVAALRFVRAFEDICYRDKRFGRNQLRELAILLRHL